MTRDQITNKLQAIFREVLDPMLVLSDNLDASKVPTWDSLNHITLVVEIEQQFGVELTTDELADLRNVGDMIDLLLKKSRCRLSIEMPSQQLKFTDLSVGMIATTMRTFSRDDIATFGRIAPDAAPVHFDEVFARNMGYRDVLVFGWLAGAPFSGLLGMELPGPATVLHSLRINMVAPVYADEEILYRVEVKQLAESVKAVVLDLVAIKVADQQVVIRGQAQCGFRL